MAARVGAHSAPRGALQASSATDLRLATRRAIASLRRVPRATAERAMGAAGGENDENEENTSALEQLALYHLRQIAVDLEDEVREYLSTGNVRESGVVSFLLPQMEGNRAEAVGDLLEGERVAAAQRSGALRALEQQPRMQLLPLQRVRAAGGADADADARRLNETFVLGGAAQSAPTGIPRISDFEGIRDYSEKISARDRAAPVVAASASHKRVIIMEEEEEDAGNPWSDEDNVEEICISARDDDNNDDDVVSSSAANVDRVVKLRAELVADRSFVATFRSGDMATTAKEIERRLRERGDAGFDVDSSREEAEDQRSLPTRSSDRRYPMLPLLESTPLKARPGTSRRHPTEQPSSTRRSIVEDPPERVSIGVGTSARGLPSHTYEQHSTGVQCELEEMPSSISLVSLSRGQFVSSEESSSFGQVPERLLLHAADVRVVQPTTTAAAAAAAESADSPTPRPRETAPIGTAISPSTDGGGLRLPPLARPASDVSLSSPDSLVRGLLQAAPPAPLPRSRLQMFPSSGEEEEEVGDNTLENLDSIRDD